MAKRFIDTGLFDDEWFSELSQECKIFWIYYLTKCDHAGLLKNNKRLIEFQTGIKSLDTVIEHFADRIITVNGLFFCHKFIQFQYPGFPKSKVKQQDGAINLLIKAGIWDENIKDFNNTYQRLTKDFKKSYVHGNVNVSGNVDDSVNDSFGKSENLLLIPEMSKIFVQHNPNYPASKEKDFRPLFEIAKYLCEVGKLDGSPDLHRTQILEAWEPICKIIKVDKFYSQKSLSTISNHIQEILQISLHGKSDTKVSGKRAGATLEGLKQKLGERFAKQG